MSAGAGDIARQWRTHLRRTLGRPVERPSLYANRTCCNTNESAGRTPSRPAWFGGALFRWPLGWPVVPPAGFRPRLGWQDWVLTCAGTPRAAPRPHGSGGFRSAIPVRTDRENAGDLGHPAERAGDAAPPPKAAHPKLLPLSTAPGSAEPVDVPITTTTVRQCPWGVIGPESSRAVAGFAGAQGTMSSHTMPNTKLLDCALSRPVLADAAAPPRPGPSQGAEAYQGGRTSRRSWPTWPHISSCARHRHRSPCRPGSAGF